MIVYVSPCVAEKTLIGPPLTILPPLQGSDPAPYTPQIQKAAARDSNLRIRRRKPSQPLTRAGAGRRGLLTVVTGLKAADKARLDGRSVEALRAFPECACLGVFKKKCFLREFPHL